MRVVDAWPLQEQIVDLIDLAKRKGDMRAADGLSYALQLIEEAPTLILRPPEEDKDARHKYGEYKNVFLSDAEMDKLRSEFPHDLEARIEAVSEYVARSGKKYKSFLAVIRSWARRDAEKEEPERESSFDTDDFIAANLRRTYGG